MTSTPVGMRCPECARQKTRVRNPGGAAGRSDAPVTYTLIGLCVAAYLLELLGGGSGALQGGGTVNGDGGLYGPAVAGGEPYRIVTAAFLHAGLIHLAFNMFALYILGTLVEPAIGSARFAAIYLLSILAGSFGALLLDPNELTVGASGGVFGLMSAAFLIARNRGLDHLASQIGIFVVFNLVITFSVSGISVGAHLGGLIGGALAALLFSAVEKRRPANAKLVEVAGVLVLCAATVAGSLLLAESSVSSVPGLA